MIQEKEIKGLTGERSQYLVRAFNDTTVRFVLNFDGIPDGEILRRAARELVESVDVLHGSFHVEKGRTFWRIYRELEDGMFYRQIHVEHAARDACGQALLPVQADEPVKLRCTLVEDGTRGSVVFCVSHMVADGGDARYLLGKLTEAYNRIARTGSAEGLAVKNGSRAPEKLYEHLSRRERRKLWKNPMPMTKNEFPFADPEPGHPRLVCRKIPRDVMAAARQKARQQGMTANDLILAACYQAYAAVPGVDSAKPIGIMAMMDLRKHCPGGDSEGLSNMAGSLKTVMRDGVTGTFEETLREIARQTREDKADPMSGLEGVPMLHHAVGRGPMGLLLKVAPVVYGNMSMGVTNLGNLNSRDYALGGLIPVSGMMGGPLKKKPGVQVSVLSVDGECALSIVGEYTDRDVLQLEAMLEDIAATIERYAQQ